MWQWQADHGHIQASECVQADTALLSAESCQSLAFLGAYKALTLLSHAGLAWSSCMLRGRGGLRCGTCVLERPCRLPTR